MRVLRSEPVVTVHEYAQAHGLPPHWLELRRECDELVRRSDFWYRPELKDDARRLAVEASDLLASVISQASELLERRKTHAG